MGLVETEDVLRRPTLVVYLHENPASKGKSGVDIVPSFTSLFFEFHPSMYLGLMYDESQDESNRGIGCVQDALLRYRGPRAELVFEKTFPSV